MPSSCVMYAPSVERLALLVGLILGELAKQMAIINASFGDQVVVDDLFVHVREEHLLLVDETFEDLGVQFFALSLSLTQSLAIVADTLLKDLKTVVTKLVVKLSQIRDGTHGGENGVVLDGVAFWTE